MRVALTALTPQGRRDVVVSGDDSASVSQVAAALNEALAPAGHLAPVVALHGTGGPRPQQQTLWVNGSQADPATPAAHVLRDGALVTADPRAARATSLAEPAGVAELRVIGGPLAGVVHRLGPGVAMIGSGADCRVLLAAPGVPPHAATVSVRWGLEEPVLTPVGPGVSIEGTEISQPSVWTFGAVVRIGGAVLTLVRPERPDAHLSPVEGGLAYHRPPRLQPAPVPPAQIPVPSEPKKGAGRGIQLMFSGLVPLALGGVMVYLTHQVLFALFMLMSPISMMGTYLYDRKNSGGPFRKKLRSYQAKMTSVQERLAQERAVDQVRRREEAMDPAQALLTATGPRRRLWERRADDSDVLRLRIGTMDAPTRVDLVREKGSPEDSPLPPLPISFSVPVSVPLAQLGVVGIAGPFGASRGLARWMVAQAAVLHSPRDLTIMVLASTPEAGQHWNWVRWLPHSAPRGNEDCVCLVGADPETAGRRVSELLTEVTTRRSAGSGPGVYGMTGPPEEGPRLPSAASADLGPKIVVVLDGARQLRRIPGMPQVLASAQQAGVCVICIDESHRMLPEECAAVLSWDIPGHAAAGASDGVHYGPGGWAVSAHDQASANGLGASPFVLRLHGPGMTDAPLLADQVSVAWAELVARALAPVRDVSRDDSDAMIPTSARLLDLIRMPDPSAEQVLDAWRRTGRSTRAPIGVGADGAVVIDISADGPHGLVAGTTGAGKSEFLQTLIASLAVVNRPDAMTFVLIDYKGGSAFKDCAMLPHTVGMVSDLDGHLTVRALASLGAELKRREEMLLHAGAKDIEDYWDTRKLQPGLEPMPRLMLIIDEFAAMVAELPDFVTGLIDIARRGRSLGTHLLLATQRPAGVVSGDIRANTNLRVALRVTSADESADVIDVGDAAFIAKSTPGRCYIKSGASSPVAVQSARVGGRRPGSGPVTASARIVPVTWQGLGRALPATRSSGEDEINLATDLSVLTEAIISANAKAGYGEQRRPWLDPLPEVLTLADLPPVTAPSKADIPPIPYGLTDLPHRQSRSALALDFSQAGHTAIAGATHSGRSTLLRTLAGSVTQIASPADVHIYGIDCGTGALGPLEDLPHCGAVVSRDAPDRIERLVTKLRAEILRRQQLLAASGFTGLMEQRASGTGPKLPWMLLLVDWWEGYVSAFENYDFGRLIDTLLQILREGSAVGLRAVVTTDRNALIGQTGAVFGSKMILRMTERDDANLIGIPARSLPNHQPAGRVMFDAKPNPLEAQVALLAPDPSGLGQVSAIRQLAAQARDRYPRPPRDLRPLRTDALPSLITFEQTVALDPDFAAPSPLWALAGAGGDELSPQGLDLNEDGPGLVIAGPGRCGRSTTLLTMARSLLRAQTPILVITPRRSPLRSLEGEPGVLAVLGADFEPDLLRETLNPLERYVVMVDDAELLAGADNADILERVVQTGRDTDHGLILAGTTADLSRSYSGFIPTALRSRSGVLMVDAPTDGDLFRLQLPRNVQAGGLGRALLLRGGVPTPVQLSLTQP
jgi:DNA segregation ATPase FtsK/SpoIIIE, S-DNA-T family